MRSPHADAGVGVHVLPGSGAADGGGPGHDACRGAAGAVVRGRAPASKRRRSQSFLRPASWRAACSRSPHSWARIASRSAAAHRSPSIHSRDSGCSPGSARFDMTVTRRSVIWSMLGLPPAGAPDCRTSAARAGNYEGDGSSDWSASTAFTLSRTSPSVSMRLINPYSAAVSAPPVRNHIPPGTSHSSTSSNSARTTSLAAPRTLSSYSPRRFVNLTCPFVCGAHTHYRLLVPPGHHLPITHGRVNLAAPAPGSAASQVVRRRGLIGCYHDHPSRGDVRVVHRMAWCDNVDDSDNRIPAPAAGPRKPTGRLSTGPVRARND